MTEIYPQPWLDFERSQELSGFASLASTSSTDDDGNESELQNITGMAGSSPLSPYILLYGLIFVFLMLLKDPRRAKCA